MYVSLLHVLAFFVYGLRDLRYSTVLTPSFPPRRFSDLLLDVTADDFTGFDPGAMWDDAKLGMRHFSGWDRVALVTDVIWLRGTAIAFSFAIPAQFRLFHGADVEEATR